MSLYTTIQGDTWDSIAYKAYGSGNEAQAGKIMAANHPLLDIFVFSAGITVNIPDLQVKRTDLPPWRQ